MHMAPCTKASISRSSGMSARISAMSATLISRAQTMRLAPSPCQTLAASALATDACVLTCTASFGAWRRARESAPRSLTMTASAPASSSASKYAGSVLRSSDSMSTLQVT